MFDALLQVSNAQSVAAASTVVSTDKIDVTAGTAFVQNRDMGAGNPLMAIFTMDTNAGATVQFQVVGSPNSDLSANTVLATTPVIAAAALTLGRQPITLDIPPTVLAADVKGFRYLGVQYITGAGTASTISAWFSDHEITDNKYYSSGFAVA
jgi:hypothetical protein